MTADALWRELSAQLTAAGCEDAAFDAACLMEDIGGVPRGGMAAHATHPLTREQEQAVRRAAAERAAGRPLQYILGEWAFLSLTLRVGEGVLIPRPDTEVLCEVAANRLRAAFPTAPSLPVLDLCAGSGCVGLGVASLCDGAHPTCVELSPQAWEYLTVNLARYPQFGGRAVQADVLAEPPAAIGDGYAALLSNPPYIPAADLPTLMREVQREPSMALDGGDDGLVFYRAILDRWLYCLRPRGICAVEVGIGQAQEVAALFAAAGLCEVACVPDYAGILRVVVAQKPAAE